MSFPRYEKYKDSGNEALGEVPHEWSTVRLRFLLRDGYEGMKIGPFGSQLTSEMLEDGGPYKVYGQENVIAGDFMRGDRQIGESKFDELSVYEVTPGDLLITMMGTSGRCDVVPAGAAQGIMDSHLLRMRLNGLVLAEFARLLIDEAPYVALQAQLAGKGSIMHGLNSSIVKNLCLLVPPLEEQRHVLEFLDHETAKIDALVEEQKCLIELLKEKRQAVISHAVTKGLNPIARMKDSGVEWFGEVPAHWSTGALTRIAERIVVGIAEAATHAYSDEGVAILRSTNIRAGKVIGDILYVTPEFAEGRGTKLINAGDLVTVRTGNAGVTAVVPESLGGCQCFTMLITTLSRLGLPAFYCYTLNSVPSQRYFALEGWGTAQVNISVPILKALPVAIPPLDEQQAIVKYLDSATTKVDELVAEAEAAAILLSERRTALISAAVTGKIDVRSRCHQEAA